MNIDIANIKKSFSQGENIINVLTDINLNIKDGEIIALLGKSGSGKSTMLSLLAGLEKPDFGEIKIGDVDITKLSESELCDWRAKNLGIVFQQFNLIPHLNAFENIILPLEINGNESKEKVNELLELVGLSNRANHLPSTLSGGEQQRVAIARAIAASPNIILADEPTGNLDSETGKKIIDILFNTIYEKKMTMILVTHDEELALRANRIIRIVGGKCLS